ncbi:MAG: GNAT family N-acetyltransferase [Cryomorphaceae bacterium]
MLDFRLLNRGQIEDEKWNHAVLSDPNFRHYPLTYYLDHAAPEWVGLVGGEYAWVWPLPLKRFPINRVVQPLLTQQLGPYGATLDEGEMLAAWRWICTAFRQVRIKFNDRYHKLDFSKRRHTNIELSLNESIDSLRMRYNRSVQSNLNKAQKFRVTVTQDTAFSDWGIRTFKQGRGKGIQELDGAFFRAVKDIYCAFESLGQSRTYAAHFDGKCCAQVMLLISNRRLLLFFSASNKAARSVGAMHAILDAIIEEHCGSDGVLDFEGSDNEQLAFFYRSFGGSEKIYLQAESARLIWPLNRLLK